MKVLLCCSLLICVSCLSAENNTDNTDKGKLSKQSQKNEIENVNGRYCGVGVTIGLQKTTANINAEFRDKSHSVNSLYYGGNFALGYHYVTSKNHIIGIEVGVDFGSTSRTNIGGALKNESTYVQAEFLKRDIFRQMFYETGNSFRAGSRESSWDNVIQNDENGVWKKFVDVLRFTGGENVSVDQVFASTYSAPLYDFDGAGNPIGNNGATLKSFISNAHDRITSLGNGDVYAGLSQISEFINRRYPVLSNVLRHLAEGDLFSADCEQVVGTKAGGGVGLTGGILSRLIDFFCGELHLSERFDRLGINADSMSGATFDDLKREMERLYNPTSQEDAMFVLSNGVNSAVIHHNVKTKASFGVCPYLAVKVGHYFKELNSSLYAKVGVMQLSGHVTPENDMFGLQDEKFRKFAPFAAVGIMRNINEKWGYMVEVSHAFKTTKRLKDANFYGIRVENKTDISRTDLRFIMTYRF